MEIPTRVDVADRDRELSSEFEAGSSLAESNPEPQFRRAERRIAVRRGALPKRTASRIRIAVIVVVVIGLAAAAYGTVYRYGTRSWRFRLNSSDDIAITGLNKVTRHQVMDVLGADIGRNVFFIPLEQRRHQLEQIPWIESASVMRLLPNRLAVQIHERTPIAFVQVHNRIELVDANGIIMDLPRRTHYSFPVILGMSESVPMPQRAAQMKTYQQLITDLDSGDAHYSKDVSEVNLIDPDDVKITVADPAGAVLVHLGNEQFLDRFKVYLSHAAEWRAQFQKLQSVDLRYDGQIIVNPDGDAPSSVSKRFATEARKR